MEGDICCRLTRWRGFRTITISYERGGQRRGALYHGVAGRYERDSTAAELIVHHLSLHLPLFVNVDAHGMRRTYGRNTAQSTSLDGGTLAISLPDLATFLEDSGIASQPL